MTIAYSINGGAEIHGVQANWQRVPIRQEDTGAITYNNWAIHTWSIDVVPMATFQTLKAAEGDSLTTLETNDIDDRNNATVYGSVILESLVNGQHTGLNVTGVQLTFRVDTTS